MVSIATRGRSSGLDLQVVGNIAEGISRAADKTLFIMKAKDRRLAVFFLSGTFSVQKKANAYYRHNIYQDLTDYTLCIALDLCPSL